MKNKSSSEQLHRGSRVRVVAGKYKHFSGRIDGFADGKLQQVYVMLDPPSHQVRILRDSVEPEPLIVRPGTGSLEEFLRTYPDVNDRLQGAIDDMRLLGLQDPEAQVLEHVRTQLGGFSFKKEE